MSEFVKSFLRDRFENGARPREFFGIFGKHPGWNDHIEDLPLPTATMAMAKQIVYVQGIGSQISSGAWTRLAPEAQLANFNHAFLWVRGSQFLVGRMWGSTDGKRRAHFPMVALFHGIEVQAGAAVGPMLGRLEKVCSDCRAARTADQVRKAISNVSNGEPRFEDGTETRLTLGVNRGTIAKLARDLHGNLPPRCRLASDATDPYRGLRFWSHVCGSLAPPDTPLLFIAPIGEPWIDILAREPAYGQFFCLRAGLPASPLTYAPDPREAEEELDAEDLVKTALGGKAAPGWSWISRIFGH
jgi:hypothetical protein